MQFISYAQNYEDVMLYRALKQINNGFYIDVGAQDPTAHSVTKAFYDKGWHGINIEPVSQWFEKLKQERPADLNLQIAAGENEGRIRFFEFPDMGLSTADPLFAEKYKESGFRVHETEVSVRRLDTICQEHSVKNIHFLKIDVEGMESAVLKGFNLKQWRPWIILIEATEPNTTIQNYKKWENSF